VGVMTPRLNAIAEHPQGPQQSFARPANPVVLLPVPFAVRRVGVFWFPAPLGLLHESYISDRQRSDYKIEKQVNF
jgi:hypothetical protein